MYARRTNISMSMYTYNPLRFTLLGSARVESTTMN